MNSIKIGIFDSGIGGLNVLKLLQAKYLNFKYMSGTFREAPRSGLRVPRNLENNGRQFEIQEDLARDLPVPREETSIESHRVEDWSWLEYIYLADNKNLPYGDKEPWQIIEFSRKIIEFLVSQKVDIIVVPCNTSSAISIDLLRAQFSVPIIDIITPIVEQTANLFRNVAVIATQGTVASNVYKKKFQSINKNVNVLQIACPKLVPLIESGKIEDAETLRIIEDYLDPIFKNPDIEALIYGCTHYSYLDKQIRAVVASNINSHCQTLRTSAVTRKKLFILEPADFITEALEEKLFEMHQRSVRETGNEGLSNQEVVLGMTEKKFLNQEALGYSQVQYFATGSLEKDLKLYEQFSHVDLSYNSLDKRKR